MIQIFCGDGKGKTTAAIGEAVRFAGYGGEVLIFQYLKDNHSSERKSLQQISGITLLAGPDNMKFTSMMTEAEKKNLSIYYDERLIDIRSWLDSYREAQTMVVLDEVLYAVKSQLIDDKKIMQLINSYQNTEWILTGRADEGLLYDHADYISKICKIRHPFDLGITARAGIEY